MDQEVKGLGSAVVSTAVKAICCHQSDGGVLNFWNPQLLVVGWQTKTKIGKIHLASFFCKILNPRLRELVFSWENPHFFLTYGAFRISRSSDFRRCCDQYLAIRRTKIPATQAVPGHTPYAASHQLSIGISTHSPRRSRVFGQSAVCGHLSDARTNPSRSSRQWRQLQA